MYSENEANPALIAPTASRHATRTEIARLLSAILASRLIINTAFRMGYVFLPELSRGLGVDLRTMSGVVSLRSSMGLLAPLFGPLSDRFGRRRVMLGGMLLLVGCALIAFLFSSFVPFAVGFIGLGLAKVIFEPSAAAYLGDRVPYERRGLVMGFSELGWASGALIGVPIVGVAIATWGWQSPFALIALGGCMALLWSVVALPTREAAQLQARVDWRTAFSSIGRHHSALRMLLVTLMFLVAGEMIAISYAAWLEQSFGVSVIMLGTIAATFAMADVGGEVLSMWSVDRFGKKRALLVGFIGTITFYLIMPLLGESLIVAVAALFLYYICFEFTIVSVFPLVSELVPEARGTMMSLTTLSASVGRVGGATAGAWLFVLAGFGANGVAAAILVGVSTFVFWFGVREGRHVTR